MEHINQFAIKGEEGTGYEDESGKGDFNCYNCEYVNLSTKSCGQKDMIKKSKRKKLPSGRVCVGALGCCEYVDRKGRDRRMTLAKWGK